MTRFFALTVAAILSFAPLSSHAQSADEIAFVRGLMESQNQLSIRFNREVCGNILRHRDGTYTSTKSSWGGHASCASMPFNTDAVVVSSWHTHAAYARAYDNEVPSTQDVEGDIATGRNGWVGTPGGRLWYIDGRTGDMRQVCGPNCLPTDPNATDAFHAPVPERMTLDQLYDRFGQAR